MRKYKFLFLATVVIFLLSACNSFDPQWIGVWIDDETSVVDVTITLDLGKDEGSVRVDNRAEGASAWLTIVTGALEGDEDTLTAIILEIYQENTDYQNGQTLTGNALLAYLVSEPPFGLGIQQKNSVSYNIDGNTIFLEGELISVLTNYQSETLEAQKQ